MKNEKILGKFLKYATLNMVGLLGISLYILADTFFISMALGADGLTALNLAIPVYSLIHGSGLMLGMGGATKFSILGSQGDFAHQQVLFSHAVYLAGMLALAFFLAGLFLSEPIAVLLGAHGPVYPMTNTYLQVLLLFAPAFLINDLCICFVRNDGNPKLAMIAMIGGSLLNIGLDYVFLFPLQMGMFGAIFATGLAPLCSLGILSLHWRAKRNGFGLVKTKWYGKIAGSLLAFGLPSFITEVSSGVVILVFNSIIMGLQGNVGVAAYGVVANLSLVCTSLFTGIAQGVQPLSSRAHGYGQHGQVKKLLRYSVALSLALSATIYLAVFLGAEGIVHVFNAQGNRQLQEIAAYGLRLYFSALFFVGPNIILSVFFTSLERPLFAQAISLMRGFALIVSTAFLLSAIWGITGVWLSFPITELLTCVFAIILWVVSRKR